MNRRRFLSSAAACVAGALALMKNDRLLIVGETFRNQTVRMTDGQTYLRCMFYDCKPVVVGQDVAIVECHFYSTTPAKMPVWRFNDDGLMMVA